VKKLKSNGNEKASKKHKISHFILYAYAHYLS